MYKSKRLKILTNKFCYPSAKLLRDSIKDMSNLNLLVTDDPTRIPPGNLFLRYGNSMHQDVSINSPEFIELASNKFAFSKLCENNGIYSPIFYDNGIPTEFPAVIRKTLRGKHAEGLVVVETVEVFKQLWRAGFYWTPFKVLRSEFRVHVAFGEILKIFKKEDNNPEEKYHIRISDNCHFSIINNPFPGLVELVNKLTGVLGVDCFYGLDVGWDSTNKKYFTLEINSAPGLNQLTADKLAKAILVKKGIEYNEIHRTEENP